MSRPVRIVLLFVVIGLVVATGVAVTVLFAQRLDRQQEALVEQQREAENQRDRLARQQEQLKAQQFAIQDQRRMSIRASCEDQNRRHDRTVRKLRALTRAAGRPAITAAPAIVLIDALAPKMDCAARVARLTSPLGAR